MRKAGYSSGRFLIENLFSRIMLPFTICLFVNLKGMLPFPDQGISIQGWISASLSLAFFYSIYINFLKSAKTIRFSRGDLWSVGLFWALLAILVQFLILYGIYNFEISLILDTYSFSKLTPWPFTVIGLIFSPRLDGIFAKKWFFRFNDR